MYKPFFVGVAAFIAFSITGVAVASVIANPDVPLTTQAAAAVERATGIDLGTHEDLTNDASDMESDSVSGTERESEHGTEINNSSDDQGDEAGDDADDQGDDESDDDGSVTSAAPAPQPAATAQTFTLAQVALHNSVTSCYTAINGGVYDVTAWINQHPGGAAAIKSLCGIDGSSAFNGQHGGQGRPASELASFKIGTLAK